MEIKQSRRTRVEISIAGKNIITNLAPYLLQVSFNDKTSNEIDDITVSLDDRDEVFCDEWMPTIGDTLEVSIIKTQDNGDEDSLYCGVFDIDLVESSGPPEIVEIKAVSSLCSDIRRKLVNKTWKRSSLRDIGKEIARSHKLEYIFLSYSDTDKDNGVEIPEITQNDQSDLAFLIKLADDNDYMVKLDPGKLTICSQKELESIQPMLTFSKCDILSRKASRQGFDLYKEAKASYFCKKSKKLKTAKASSQDQIISPAWLKAHQVKSKSKPKANSKSTKIPTKPVSVYSGNAGNKVLILRQRFDNEKDAKQFAEAQLIKKNRGEWMLSGSVMGNVDLLAGTTIDVVDYGQYNGVYFIEKTTHTIDSSGYRTSFIAHKAHIEGQV